MSGTYTDIIKIVAPNTASAGQTVNVQVLIKNTHSAIIGIMVRGALEYGVSPWPTIDFPDNSDNVAAGITKTFYGSFIMPYYPPGKIITIHAYSYWYSTGLWHFDDELTKDVETVAPEEPEAAITQFKIVDYSEA